MPMKHPDELAKGETEHGLQRALFAWSNMARYRGFAAANDPATWAEEYPLKAYVGPDAYLNALFPELEFFHAIHNQGHGDAIRGAQAKAEGVKTGIPDTFFPLPRKRAKDYAGLYIENKLPKYERRKDGGLSEDQLKAIRYLRWAGYAVVVAFSWRQAASALEAYYIDGVQAPSLY